MHPTLQMKNVKSLPVSIRNIASKATAQSRKCTDVQLASRTLRSSSLSTTQRLALLPLFFANLDPAKIPSMEQLDELHRHPAVREDVLCAVVALDATFSFSPHISPAVGPSLWPRVWAWFDFVCTYREYLLDLLITFPPEKMFYLEFITFTQQFEHHPASYALMSTTPGFWGRIVEAPLGYSGVDPGSSRLEEVIEAAGSLDDFAPCVRPAVLINHLFLFVTSISDCPTEEFGVLTRPLSPLMESLCEVGFAVEMVRAVVLLSETWEKDKDAPDILDTLLMVFNHFFLRTSAKIWLKPALEYGLLGALALITLKLGGPGSQFLEDPTRLEDLVRNFLSIDIPRGLVYFYPLAELPESLAEVRSIISRDDFKRSPPSEDWDRFFLYSQHHLDALKEFHISPAMYKACDNIECGIIDEADSLRRCTGCQAFYYCSRECQAEDWDARHRDVCVAHENLLLKCLGGIVDPLSAEWDDLAVRADMGEGYWQMHGMHVMNGQEMRVWIIPLRTDSADIWEALISLADRVREGEVEGEEVILEAVDGILDEHEEVMEIH
ncbi:hypothetical protein FB45DRAFT_1066421 [Roridomyces roridus]|uniref:MYND-type domain-containing protein n=1 Tax=Roridomyces roridus TaxID=1738132 RepID=A0AAD7B4E6_9AGAR|nr:hypothetical protein FB45DRAFT_1066421 [Roridomyces roridus]